jgi:large subunit ribosomal protein L4
MTVTDTVTRGPVKKERPAPITRTVERRNVAGEVLGTVDLEPSIFGIEPNLPVLHQVVTAQLAAIRAGTQSTKTRAQVRGGGAKPFAQKGTGRARQGSSRSPSMSGGGVALGPKPRSYRQHTPKKMVRLALLSALSDRAAINRVALVDRWSWDGPKTKDAVAALGQLEVAGYVLVVLADDEKVARQSFANLPEVRTTTFGQLSAHDVLRCDWIVFSDRTLPGADAFAGGAGVAEAEPAVEKPAAAPKAAATPKPAAPKPAATPKPAASKPAVAETPVAEPEVVEPEVAETEPVTEAEAETEEADTDA